MESSDQGSRWAKARFAEIVQGGGDIPLDEMAFLISAIVLGTESSSFPDFSEIIEQMSRLDE